MKNKLLLSATVALFMTLAQIANAAEECKEDKDCKDGNVCVLAVTPHVCKPPQPAGEACKRDAVCASKKCNIPAGQEKGVCA